MSREKKCPVADLTIYTSSSNYQRRIHLKKAIRGYLCSNPCFMLSCLAEAAFLVAVYGVAGALIVQVIWWLSLQWPVILAHGE
jgi:hypothetical protein